jgi:hypothetical protein
MGIHLGRLVARSRRDALRVQELPHWRLSYLILQGGSLTNPISTMLWGFSKSDNPTTLPGGFCNYETDFGWGGTIADYPKLGTTEDFLLIGANINPIPATFLESDVGWIIKPVKSEGHHDVPVRR